MRHILVTAFRNTSAELLVRGISDSDILLLPNDKVLDSEKLISTLSNRKYDSIISIGQRPNIKDKVHVETMAREGLLSIGTTFDCDMLVRLFEEAGIQAKLSCNAGTSYCNCLYFYGLRYLREKQPEAQMVFVHVPFQKNITDFEHFRRQFLRVIAYIQNQ